MNKLLWIDKFILIFYFLDMGVRFNTAYFDELGEKIFDRRLIV